MYSSTVSSKMELCISSALFFDHFHVLIQLDIFMLRIVRTIQIKVNFSPEVRGLNGKDYHARKKLKENGYVPFCQVLA